ncbi:MAG: hypothetical protein ACHRXM_24515 [Isosphaerales bacterium]
MEFRETVSALLPPPRDDEPATLRQDILDELGDHLACAYKREVLRGVEASVARQHVLERFGDPAAVARRLWLEAMKGKIMAQRALIATCLVVTIVSLSLAGLLWFHSREAARQLAEAEARMAESMAEARITNQEMLRQLQAMATGDHSTQTPHWIPVTFQLTQETLDGPPAAGYSGYLGRGNGGSMSAGSIHRECDEKGLVDFGVVQPGDWEFRIFRSPAQEGRMWKVQGNINVLPGTKVAKTVICPQEYSENIPVRLRVDWPVDLANQDLHVAAQFGFAGITYQPALRWRLGPWQSQETHPVRNILCRPGGKQAEIVKESNFRPWQVGFQNGGVSDSPVFADLFSDSLSRTADAVDLAAGDYRLDRLIVLRPVTAPKPNFPAERFDFIAQVLFPYSESAGLNPHEMFIFMVRAAPSGKTDPPRYGNRMARFNNILFPSSYRDLTKGRFEARVGRVNEWVIPLPDELIKVVREKLKAGATTKAR